MQTSCPASFLKSLMCHMGLSMMHVFFKDEGRHKYTFYEWSFSFFPVSRSATVRVSLLKELINTGTSSQKCDRVGGKKVSQRRFYL